MSTHPRRPTVLLPRIAAYGSCCVLVLIEAGSLRPELLGYLAWLLALPGLTWLELPPRVARTFGLMEDVLVPLGALALGLPGVVVATLAILLLLGHCNISGSRRALQGGVATASTLVLAGVAVSWPPWSVSPWAEALALCLVVVFACAAGLISHRQKQQLEQARCEIARRADHHAALAERLARYLPPAVHRVAFEQEGGTVSGSHRRWLTVCFADLAGFTALTDVAESEEVVAMLDDFYTAMAEAALERGGTLDKFIGDAVMVFFGEPVSLGREGDARACIAMAEEMQTRFGRLRERWLGGGISRDLGLRIGVHSGWCTVGSFGKAARMEYTVIGATVNAASRLESAAVPGQILLSRATWRLLGAEARACRRLGPISAKGFQQPIDVFEYQGGADGREPMSWQGDGFTLQLDPGAADPDQVRRVLMEASEAFDGPAREPTADRAELTLHSGHG